MRNCQNTKIAIIGLGYVGLPLAMEFAKRFSVVGFDKNSDRIVDLKMSRDYTQQVNIEELKNAVVEQLSEGTPGLLLSASITDIKTANFYIVTVPTPVDEYKRPDLSMLFDACKLVGRALKKDDIVIFESTVFPGCTEEECVPILEHCSKLKFNVDFFVGYSPERINPGDKEHNLVSVRKVTSGSTYKVATLIDELYKTIINAGTYLAPSIKVAEAAKVIENAQRDVNISFVNELSLIFDKMNIDTYDVLDAAATKYNFHLYKPGLVGGHCISVDPYYLAHKAIQLGYHPQVILSGRRVNDVMPQYIAAKVVKLMIKNSDRSIKGGRVLILGFTFKENCPDVRNSKVVDVYRELIQFGLQIDIYDPWADYDEVKREFGIELRSSLDEEKMYSVILLAVAHDLFTTLDYNKYKKVEGIIFDLKGVLDRELVDVRL